MSLRAIKKRENHLNTSTNTRQTLFKKSATSSQQRKQTNVSYNNNNNNSNNSNSNNKYSNYHQKQTAFPNTFRSIKDQRSLLGRLTHSNPEFHHYSDVLEQFIASEAHAGLVRTKSESDVNTLLSADTTNSSVSGGVGALMNAKSEVCLESIATHDYQFPSTTTLTPQQQQQEQEQEQEQEKPRQSATTLTSFNSNILSANTKSTKMLSRSHRDLAQSSYNASSDITLSPTRRRLSECSLNSSTGYGYSQRTSIMSTSALTLSSNATFDPNTVVRVPIIGYEVMEERARFTVYKLRVENPITNDCWLVLRRYTDFVRLHTKLKQSFPQIALMLPRKKIFGDNFNSVFLDNRVQGLQMFVNSVMTREELRKCKIVREFFCLDEPPTYSESMEECRAIFEAQEETIAHLKLQISNKNDLILSLQQKLRDEILEKEQLKETLKNMSFPCERCMPQNDAASLN